MKRAAIVLASVTALFAENQVNGPVSGWIWDADRAAVRPILGIPGASILGRAMESGVPLARAESDQRRYALGIGRDDGSIHLIEGRSGASRQLPDVPSNPASFRLSPNGDSAVFQYARRLVVVAGLPDAPRIAREIDLAGEGDPSFAAINDSGRLVLAAYPQDRAVLVIDGDGNRWKLPHAGAARSLQFADAGNDVIMADDRGVWLARDVAGNGELVLLWEGDARAAAITSDNRNAVVINDQAQVIVVSLETGHARDLECPCEPTTLARMAGGRVFRLNEGGTQTLWMVDLNGAEPRAVFVPADAKTEE